MIVGNSKRFAIEVDVDETSKGRWLTGHFRFWLGDRPVGDWEDFAWLRGCRNWLRDFAENPRDRFDARLESLDASEIFKLTFDAVMVPGGIADPRHQPIPYAFERFHISHLGMSSFDKYAVLLIKTAEGKERCIWKNLRADGVHEVVLEPGEMEATAREFCDAFDHAYPWPS